MQENTCASSLTVEWGSQAVTLTEKGVIQYNGQDTKLPIMKPDVTLMEESSTSLLRMYITTAMHHFCSTIPNVKCVNGLSASGTNWREWAICYCLHIADSPIVSVCATYRKPLTRFVSGTCSWTKMTLHRWYVKINKSVFTKLNALCCTVKLKASGVELRWNYGERIYLDVPATFVDKTQVKTCRDVHLV